MKYTLVPLVILKNIPCPWTRITKILEAMLINFEMDRSRYDGGDLEGILILRLLKILIRYSMNIQIRLIRLLLTKNKKLK